MSSLKDKLNNIYNKEDTKEDKANKLRKQLNRIYRNKKKKPSRKQKSQPDFTKLIDLLDGNKIESADQSIILVKNRFNMSDNYGDIDLRRIYDYTGADYDQYLHVGKIKYPEQLLFIDTETTGLAGGTGTIAFMIGIGWIENQIFYTWQYFLPELKSEGLLLQKVKEKTDGFSALVSYNGKSFDLPMLTSRFLLNRQKPIPENLPHIDLLHLNRSLWRYSSENCKLQTIEAEKFQLYREDDIPGELIPSVYFNFLNNRGDIRKVVNIFEHNRLDIISMLANLICVFEAFKKESPSKDPLDDYAKGRHFKRRKKIKRSIRHYKNVLSSDITENRRFKTLMELAGIYKKEKQYLQAIPLWLEAIELDFASVTPLIELAKYYEHKTRRFSKAIEYTEQALNIVEENDVITLEKLRKRLQRLKRKSKKEK